jgi:hypothetical protein
MNGTSKAGQSGEVSGRARARDAKSNAGRTTGWPVAQQRGWDASGSSATVGERNGGRVAKCAFDVGVRQLIVGDGLRHIGPRLQQ